MTHHHDRRHLTWVNFDWTINVVTLMPGRPGLTNHHFRLSFFWGHILCFDDQQLSVCGLPIRARLWEILSSSSSAGLRLSCLYVTYRCLEAFSTGVHPLPSAPRRVSLWVSTDASCDRARVWNFVCCCCLPEVPVGGNHHIRSFGLSRVSLNSTFSCIYMATAGLAWTALN